MSQVNIAATSTSNSPRTTALLIAAAVALAAIGAPSMSHGQGRWVTASSADGATTYAASASETACRAAQADTAVVCLSGSDMRQVNDGQMVAAR